MRPLIPFAAIHANGPAMRGSACSAVIQRRPQQLTAAHLSSSAVATFPATFCPTAQALTSMRMPPKERACGSGPALPHPLTGPCPASHSSSCRHTCEPGRSIHDHQQLDPDKPFTDTFIHMCHGATSGLLPHTLTDNGLCGPASWSCA